MKKVIIVKGLPASGKSTWAKKTLDDNTGSYKRVNKDDLRAMLDNGKWSGHNEKFVLRLRDHIILEALKDGKHVIVDDTNLHPKHEIRIRQLIKDHRDEVGDTTVQIKDFTDVDLDTCIERDKARENSVGEKTIRGMHSSFLDNIKDIGDIPLKDIWVISDTHFTHQMLVDKGIRPEDYNEQIKENWNKLIPEDAVVVHLGDVIFGYEKERLKGILAELNGRKILVKGNHDYKPNGWWLDMGFESVHDKLVWKDVLFTHIPEALPKDKKLNIHGHLHGTTGHRYEQVQHLLTPSHKLIALELNGYKPERLTDLI